MRIALDATPLAVPIGGIRRYVEEVTRSLLADFPANEYWYFSDQPFSNAESAIRTCSPPTSFFEKRWWMLGASRQAARLGIDVFHGTDFAVPYLPRCASVMTLHDLSPWRENGVEGGASSRVRTRTKALLRMRVPTMIVTPSEAVRREAIELFSWPASRIVAIPLAPAPWLKSRLEIVDSSETPSPPYLLYVGTIEQRKNVSAIIEAWKLLPEGTARLILAGRKRDDFPAPAEVPGLEWRRAVTDDELALLYANAAAVLYLSNYEGFGLPVLEAMRCGAPVIASNAAAVRETAGDAAVIVDPRDTRAVAAAMAAVLNDREKARELRERGVRRASEFSWQRTARETHAVYVEALARYQGARTGSR